VAYLLLLLEVVVALKSITEKWLKKIVETLQLSNLKLKKLFLIH